ncbi:MAG: tetratricopeptide repeat protein [Cyclobacteriaceae bacterium]|nr:tetratricopeptide repeat protein [Cyclobacteriaceae bacterium]
MFTRLAAGLLLLLCGLGSFTSRAQLDSLSLSGSTLFQVNSTSIMRPTFTWTLQGKAQPQMNEALEEFDEGRWQRAAILFKSVLDADSTFWPARYYYAVCQKGLGDISGARTQFEKLVLQQPKVPEIWMEYGGLFQSVKQFSQAEDAYLTAVKVKPDLAKGYYVLGALYIAIQSEQKARKNFERCLELDPQSAEAHLGLAFLKLLKVRKASKIDMTDINNAIVADSTYRPALYWRGFLHLQKGDYTACVNDWNRFLHYMPNNPFVLRSRSLVLIQLNQFEEAYADLRKALQIMPEAEAEDSRDVFSRSVDFKSLSAYLSVKGYGLHDSAFFSLKRAFCFLSIGDQLRTRQAAERANAFEASAAGYLMAALGTLPLEYALPYYNKAIELDRDFFEAYRLRAIFMVTSHRNYPGALKDTQEMQRIKPQSKLPYQMRALIYAMQDNCTAAMDNFSQFLDKNSTDIEGFRIRAKCRKKIQDYKGACEDLRRSIRLEPSRDLYADLFQTLLKAGDSTGAIHTLRQVTMNWPDEPELKLALADLLQARGVYDSAQSTLGEALDLIQKTTDRQRNVLMATYHSLSAKILIGKKDYETGLKELNRAVSFNPYEYSFVLDRAKLLIKMGQIKQATKDLSALRKYNYEPARSLWDQYLN